MLDQNWKVQVHPEAKKENILQGDKYRITLLTEGLIRLEYSEEGIFEDRATQCVWNRDFPEVKFSYEETEDSLEIFTSMVHLIYNKKKFSPNAFLSRQWEISAPMTASGITEMISMIWEEPPGPWIRQTERSLWKEAS